MPQWELVKHSLWGRKDGYEVGTVGTHRSDLKLKFCSILFVLLASNLGSRGVQSKTLSCLAKLTPDPGVGEVNRGSRGKWRAARLVTDTH